MPSVRARRGTRAGAPRGGAPGAEWGRAAQQVVLEGALGVVDQRLGEALAVAEAVEDRALGDARLARDVAHRHRGHAVGVEQAAGGVEHAAAVAGRVGALRARSALDGELGHDCQHNLTADKFMLI